MRARKDKPKARRLLDLAFWTAWLLASSVLIAQVAMAG